MTNRERALRAGEMLDAIRELHEEGPDVSTETLVVDFLTDLMHYADHQATLNFREALGTAEIHFESEKG